MTKEFLKKKVGEMMRTNNTLELSRNGKKIIIQDDADDGYRYIWIGFDDDKNFGCFTYYDEFEGRTSAAKLTDYIWEEYSERISAI